MQNGLSERWNESFLQLRAERNWCESNARRLYVRSCTTLNQTHIECFVFARMWFIPLKRLNTLLHWAVFVCTCMWEMEATAYVQVMDRTPWVWPGMWETGWSNNTAASNSPSGYVHTRTHTHTCTQWKPFCHATHFLSHLFPISFSEYVRHRECLLNTVIACTASLNLTCFFIALSKTNWPLTSRWLGWLSP